MTLTATSTVTSPPATFINIIFILLNLILFTTASLAADASQSTQQGTMLMSSDLKKEPFLDAETIVNIPKNTKVNILNQQGGWYQVRIPAMDNTSNNVNGWVRLTSLRLRPAPAPDLSGIPPTGKPATANDSITSINKTEEKDLYEDEHAGGTSLQKALSGVSFGRSGITESATTTGIRGLGKEDIANAQPNTQALDDLHAMTDDIGDSSEFANSSQLKSIMIDYLIKPDAGKPDKKPSAEDEE